MAEGTLTRIGKRRPSGRGLSEHPANEGGNMRTDYRRWLESQDYSSNTINTQCSHTSRAEDAYGDLDAHFRADRLEDVLGSLKYSSEDARRGKPNPAKVTIAGDPYKSLASFRSAVGLYRRFLDEQIPLSEQSVERETMKVPDREVAERIGLERDLQKALRREIEQLESGFVVIDEGVERSVASGFIDITARDSDGAVVVIELKASVADRTAIGQILSYMGDVSGEEPDMRVRGMLVAHSFDAKAKAAAKMVPSLGLRSYAIKFTFVDATADEATR
jgi:hypothetical protein